MSNVLENIAGDISFRRKHDGLFQVSLKMKGSLFYYQNLPDPKVLWHSKLLEKIQIFTLKNGSFS